MNKRVLVTGAGGFIGGHVVRELRSLGYELLTPSREELDLLQADVFDGEPHSAAQACALYLIQNSVDAIVHLAATCGGIGINKENPGRFIYENLQMGVNILEAARMAGRLKVVNLGTVCAYPKHTPVPFKEEDIYNGYPEETNAPYGIAKRTVMEMGRAYSQQYGMDITNLVPVNMYGEGDNFNPDSSHVIPALIRKFESPHTHQHGVETLTADDPHARQTYVSLWGTGSASREFLHASDCARAIGIALEKKTGADPINLGTGNEISIRMLAEKIQALGGYRSHIIWDTSKPDGQPRRCLDISRARSVLRWEPTVSFDEGLKKVIQWYRANAQQ